MAMTTADTLAFYDLLLDFMTTHDAELKAKGLDLTAVKTSLVALRQTLLARDGEQETLKTQLHVKTDEVNAAQDALYKPSSAALDAIVGALGKTTEPAKQAARIRSQFNSRSKSAAAPPPVKPS